MTTPSSAREDEHVAKGDKGAKGDGRTRHRGHGGNDDRRTRQKATNTSQEAMVKGAEDVNDDERGTLRREGPRGVMQSTPRSKAFWSSFCFRVSLAVESPPQGALPQRGSRKREKV
jgi:hypothetical protein